jgi:hypothetical protein
MHVSRADLPAMVFGDYEGRTVDYTDGSGETMAAVARNMAGVAS